MAYVFLAALSNILMQFLSRIFLYPNFPIAPWNLVASHWNTVLNLSVWIRSSEKLRVFILDAWQKKKKLAVDDRRTRFQILIDMPCFGTWVALPYIAACQSHSWMNPLREWWELPHLELFKSNLFKQKSLGLMRYYRWKRPDVTLTPLFLI